MEGFKLTKGEIVSEDLTDDEIWSIFKFIYSSKSKNQSSYKYGFIRSILENLYNNDATNKIELTSIFSTFTRVYWNLVIHEKLKQTDSSHEASGIERLLVEFKEQNNIHDKVLFDKLSTDLQLSLEKQVFKIGKRYVVGALYGDSQGKFYSFNLKENFICLNPPVLSFLKKHQETVFKLNNYELAKFLLQNNKHTPHNIIAIIENISKRGNLNIYRKTLEKHESDCFYCNTNLKNKQIEVDHFIPWSFIHSDNLWNLVLSCNQCNRIKKDRIPDRLFLEKLFVRNTRILTELENYTENKLDELYIHLERNNLLKQFNPLDKGNLL
jgi:5-methylcytosine-specific restriction endonuclease McrA